MDDAPASPSLSPTAKAVLDAIDCALIIFDTQSHVVHANCHARGLLEIPDRADALLTPHEGAARPDADDLSHRLRGVLANMDGRPIEITAPTRDGQNARLRVACNPIRAGADSPVGGILLIEDVTQSERVRQELASQERLAVMGRLAAKVAHELNGPIDGILRYISLALRCIESEGMEKPQEYLRRCQEALIRMVHILSELLEFSRSSRVFVEQAPVEQVIEESLRILGLAAEGASVRVFRDYAEGLPKVRTGNLFQVFCNMTKNALEAMPSGGDLHITTRPVEGSAIAVEFRDTGGGFAPDDADSLFEPFFTTKDKGTGLGLAICRDIVSRHGGRMTAENVPGGGSRFTVYLPVGEDLVDILGSSNDE